MYDRLSIEKREELLLLLTAEQRDFLMKELKRGRRTIFENVMRDEKISAIKSIDTELEEDELLVIDWMIIDFADYGLGNLAGQCACGRKLRYQFTVEHQQTGKIIQYGKDHLSVFLNIDVKDINGVINELDRFDHELDELLWKVKHGEYGYEVYEKIQDKTVVSPKIVKHIEVNVPLLDRQMNLLKKYLEKQLEALLEEQREIQIKLELEEQQQRNEKIEKLIQEKKKIEDMLEDERKARSELEKKRKQQEKEKVLLEKMEQDARLKATIELVRQGAKIDEIAYSLVMNGVNSAVEISWIIVKNFDVDKRISIGDFGRPYIYFDILIALSKQVNNGYLLKDEASDGEDCIFYVNPEPVQGNSKDSEEIQQEFSLF
ncbi:hypothetical protein MKX53_18830 [Psychrobacillus sp. FSL K6-4615]|uniref:hypothetical protein n=1 Tax=Psychrobacillus sp. FSL K6-4615 TaxID=2921551 RepID=UPI0030FA7FB2